MDRDQQAQVMGMLRDAHDEVKKHYYDPKLQGVDWDARYQHYQELLGNAHSLGEGFRIVAAYSKRAEGLAHLLYASSRGQPALTPVIDSQWWATTVLLPRFGPGQRRRKSFISATRL